MKKTNAIRAVVNKNWALTNQQIKDVVYLRYGLTVQTNEIINTIGPFHKRLQIAGHSKELISKAKEYLILIGDFQLSRSLLLVAQQELEKCA